jgi:hypothetical protein
MSYPERTNMSGQDGTNMSAKVYSSNNTHKTVNGYEEKTKTLGPNGPIERPKQADGAAQMGQPIPDNKPYIKQTVNGSENPIRKLPVLDQPQEKTQDIAERILERIGDPKSKKFYLLVASRIPEIAIKTNVGEIVADGADNPAKLFTYRMMKWAEEKLAQTGGVGEVKNQREQLADAMRA